MSESRGLLRHALATVAYRGGKALRGAPESFAGFRPGPASRSALEILAHVGDLFEWALSMAEGRTAWREAPLEDWPTQVERFFDGLSRFDDRLSQSGPLGVSEEILFQGPVADALAHIGQLNLMRRLAGSAVRGENYARAEIAVGRVGEDQQAPRREFD